MSVKEKREKLGEKDLTKTIYSDEEIKQILHALFLEKKKNKELATKLKEQGIEANRVREEASRQQHDGQAGDMAKLKQLLAIFKKKIEIHQQELKEKEGKINTLSQEVEDKTFLEEENNSLALQVSFLKDSLKNLFDENQKLRAKDSNAANFLELKERLEEAESLRASFEKQALELIRQVHTLEPYKQQTEDLQKKIAHLEKHTANDMQTIKCLEDEKNSLSQQISFLKLKVTQLSEVKPAPADDKIQKELAQAQSKVDVLETVVKENVELLEREKQRIEKLSHQLLEKDKRIGELLHVEKSLKKAAEQKQDFEQLREKELQQIQTLEEEKKKLAFELGESRQHSEQLDRVILFLRERSEEARLETKQWQEEHQRLQEKVDELKHKLEESEGNSQSLKNRLEDSTTQQQELQSESNSLVNQFSELKQKIQWLQTQVDNAKTNETTLQNNLQATFEQKELLSKRLIEKTEQFEILEKEVLLIKQSLLKGLRETKELNANYQLLAKDKADTNAKLAQSQNHIDRQREEIHRLQLKLEEGSQQKQELQQQITTLESRLQFNRQKTEETSSSHASEIDQLQSLLLSKEETEKELKNQIAEIQNKKEALEDQLEDSKDLLKEKESELDEAKQHFAKKVKEAAVLEEKLEEQRRHSQEQQQILTHNKVKIAELQTSLELQTSQQKQIQEQLQEALKSSESAQSKWEEKYFVLYDNWQAAKGKINELEKLEEKQKHLQGLLSNIGTFFGTGEAIEPQPQPQSPIPKAAEPKKIETEILKPQMEEKPKESTKPYQSLFNMPKPPGRPRQSFLE